jgi:outer membrane protein assembly factor BamA
MTIRLIALVLIAVSVNIFAQAGTPYELSKIKFTGNEKISGSDLELIISSEETPWWFYKFINSFSPLGSPAVYFDSANVRMDIDALKKYYEDNGFFKAKINAVIEKDTAAKTISLTYNIEENAQSRFGVITYRGIESLPDNIEQRIYSETMINPDLFYKKSLIDQNMDHVLEILLNRGYMYVMWDSTSIYKDTSANTAGVEMCFSTGNRFKISEIQVVKRGEGATGVDDNMLRNLTGIQKEEYYNNQKIKTAQARLVRTGLFHQINFQPARRDTSGDYVPLKLDGNIGLMNEFLPGISVNNEFKSFNLVLSAIYTMKNFLGNARKLTLTSELSVVDIAHFSFNEFFSSHNNLVDGYALLNLKLEQPYLFQQPINGILENYFQTSTRNAVNNKTYGIKATFDFEMPYYTFINQLSPFFNLEFYDAKITDYVRFSLVLPKQITFSFLHQVITSLLTLRRLFLLVKPISMPIM